MDEVCPCAQLNKAIVKAPHYYGTPTAEEQGSVSQSWPLEVV